MIPQITVQLYSVRDQAAADYEGTIRAIAAMGFGCVEPAGYPGYSAEKAAKLFQELGLKAPTCHGALPIGENKNKMIEEALLLGHEAIITGCPPKFKENFASADAIKATAELYCEAAANVAAHGLQVGYHNHDWDLLDVDGAPGYRIFLDHTPATVLWEADVFWVAKAGRDPVAFLQEIGPRGKALHFKDGVIKASDTFTEAETESGKIMVSNSSPFLPAGTGQVDLLAASKAATFAQYIAVELDSYPGDMMKAVQESYQYLTSNGIARGLK
ncbi:sugar phosphate isomerase/epimerase [soil metagenome]